MADGRVKRRLAAILAADVVGYSRLMEQDEAGTLASLKARRKTVVEPLVASHEGRIFKDIGDGLLAEFSSAVAAVDCAIELQREMGVANGDQPEERHIVLRIGVNLGDVMVEGSDLYGDGINIASRLEGLAEPGGILVSGTIYDHARNKVRSHFEDVGPQTVKNIAEPVRVYRVTNLLGEQARAFKKLSDKPSIAVLPFINMSGDPEQQYFSDGITEDIITELSRFHRLAVLSASSSSRYHDIAGGPRADRNLGIQYVVEGSVRRLGERVRITAKLLDAPSGTQLWADRYDRNQFEIFAVQDEIVQTIVGTIAGRVETIGGERAQRKLPANLAAYECVLRGRALAKFGIGDPEAEAEAGRYYERAIELDPEYAQAYAKLAHILSLKWFREETDSNVDLDRAYELAKRSVNLDANEPDSQNILGWVYLLRQSFELAEQYYRRALELNPNDAEQIAYMGILQTFMGNAEDALIWFQTTRRVDPYFERSWYWPMQGLADFCVNRFDVAIASLNRSPSMPLWVRVYLVACHALAGNLEAAATFKAEVTRAAPNFSPQHFARKEPWRRQEDRARLLEGLRMAHLE